MRAEVQKFVGNEFAFKINYLKKFLPFEDIFSRPDVTRPRLFRGFTRQ